MEEDIVTRVALLEAGEAGIKERLSALESITAQMNELSKGVNELAINMSYMVKEQREIKAKVQKIEEAPIAEAAAIRREVLKCLVSGVLGAVIAAVMTLILR